MKSFLKKEKNHGKGVGLGEVDIIRTDEPHPHLSPRNPILGPLEGLVLPSPLLLARGVTLSPNPLQSGEATLN